MSDHLSLKARVHELAGRTWNQPATEDHLEKLMRSGIPRKELNPNEILAQRRKILDRVQRRGEEYEYVSHN